SLEPGKPGLSRRGECGTARRSGAGRFCVQKRRPPRPPAYWHRSKGRDMANTTSAGGCPFTVPSSVEERTRQWTIYQPWLQDDPIPYWKEMRAQGPIVRSEELGGYWILTRYEDVEWAARNPDVFSNARIAIPHRQFFPAKQIPIQLDGEEHRKWRQALSELFNPAVVNHFAPQIRQATIDTIEPLVQKGQCEFISEVATRLPAETFVITFGIGREYVQDLLDHKEWLRREGI